MGPTFFIPNVILHKKSHLLIRVGDYELVALLIRIDLSF